MVIYVMFSLNAASVRVCARWTGSGARRETKGRGMKLNMEKCGGEKF